MLTQMSSHTHESLQSHLDGCLVPSQHLCWLVKSTHPRVPHTDDVVVATSGECSAVGRPLHTTHLQMVELPYSHTVAWLPHIMHVNFSTLAPTVDKGRDDDTANG